jgi:hypothetical protein
MINGQRKIAVILAFILMAAGIWFWTGPEQRSPASIEDKPSQSAPEMKRPREPAKGKADDVRTIAADAPLKDWNQARDPFTGKVRTYSGGKIELPGQTETEKAGHFVREYARILFGVTPEDLAFEKASRAARLKVVYQQMAGGYPVFGSTLALLFENGELQRVQNDLQSEAGLPPKPEVDFGAVFEAYRRRPGAGLRAQAAVTKTVLVEDPALSPRLVLYPADRGLVFVYQFHVDESPGGRAMVLYDPSGNRVVKKTALRIE